MKEPIIEVSEEQDARDLPDIVAKEETGNGCYDDEEQGIEAAVDAFDVDGPGAEMHYQHGKERKQTDMDASTKDPSSPGAAHLWPNIASNVH